MSTNASYTVGAANAVAGIIAGDTYTMQKVTIISGENLTAGAVLGKITASTKHNLSLSAAVDGSEVPDMVLAEDCDASAGDVEAMAYETAPLVGSALTVGTGHTLASIREGLRVKGLTIAG